MRELSLIALWNGAGNLLKTHLKYGGSMAINGPLANPATVVMGINADALEWSFSRAEPDAVSLMQLHDGQRTLLIAV